MHTLAGVSLCACLPKSYSCLPEILWIVAIFLETPPDPFLTMGGVPVKAMESDKWQVRWPLGSLSPGSEDQGTQIQRCVRG